MTPPSSLPKLSVAVGIALIIFLILSMRIDFLGQLSEGDAIQMKQLYKMETFGKNKPHLPDSRQVGSTISREELWGCYWYNESNLNRRVARNKKVLESYDCKKKLPFAILLGMKKCGSQSLMAFFDLHPDLVTSIPPSFVCDMNTTREEWLNGMPWTTPTERIFLDTKNIIDCPWYFKKNVELLNNPSLKVVVIVRNPRDRALSDYVHVNVVLRRLGEKRNIAAFSTTEMRMVLQDNLRDVKLEKVVIFKGYKVAKTFEGSVMNISGHIDETSRFISIGNYAAYIKHILTVIPKEHLLVVDGNDFIDKPWVILKDIENFFNIRNFFSRKKFVNQGNFFCPAVKDRSDSGCLPGKGRSKPKVDKKVWKMLGDYFHPLNEELNQMFHKKFNWY